MTVYKNADVYGKITDITVENGKFVSFEPTDKEGIDLKGNKVYPGLIDIHIHGGNGMSINRDIGKLEELSCYLAKEGITSYYPSYSASSSYEKMLEISAQNIEGLKGANILGFHAEGPFLHPEKAGAMVKEHFLLPDLEKFKKLKNVKIVTVAPELEGSEEFIKNTDAVVCIGHTTADYDTAKKAAEWGAKCVTHTFNAMPPMLHRDPSVVGAAITENLYVQVISDGIHLHPAVVMMLYKVFGKDRMILISDNLEMTGLPDGEYNEGDRTVYVKIGVARIASGNLCGSTYNLLKCVKQAIKFGVPEKDAFLMASETPAKLMGLNKGALKPGFDAEFIVLDKELNLKTTVINGEIFN